MASAIADLRVWRRLVGARIRADWQYRTSFFLFLLSQTLVACLDLAVIAAIFTQVSSLGGWSGVEVALLFGLSGVAFGLADLLISAVENASRHIKAGTFDLFLLRPLPPLVHLSASEFALRRVGRVIQPLVVLIGALFLAPIDWSPEAAVLLPVTLVSGTVIFGSVWVATSSISFWTVDSQEVAQRVHLRRIPRHELPDRPARPVAPPPPHLHRAPRLRRVLPGRPAPRQGAAVGGHQRHRLAHTARRRPCGGCGAGGVASRRPPPSEHGKLT